MSVAAASFSAVVLATADGEGWLQVGELALAFVLSAVIGLERELRQKSAGLRAHTPMLLWPCSSPTWAPACRGP